MKLIMKSQWNERIQEVSEFHRRHYCKTKISRGSAHYFRTYWQDTGIAKRKLIVWMIPKIFRMLNQFEVEIPDVTSRPGFSRHPIPGGMLSHSVGMPSRGEGPPSIWGHTWFIGNTFLQIQRRHLQHLIRRTWIHGVPKVNNRVTHQRWKRARNKHKFKIRYVSLDSQPNKSVIFSGGDSSMNYGADQQRLQISDLHFDKFTTPATFACWKIRFKTEGCTCSQFL